MIEDWFASYARKCSKFLLKKNPAIIHAKFVAYNFAFIPPCFPIVKRFNVFSITQLVRDFIFIIKYQ